jgi:hypothetical protein
MNRFLTAAALATLLVSPALAQQAGPSERPDAITYPMPPQSASGLEAPGSSAYASSGVGVVVVDGIAVGADPDPNVRLQLRRDPGANAN